LDTCLGRELLVKRNGKETGKEKREFRSREDDPLRTRMTSQQTYDDVLGDRKERLRCVAERLHLKTGPSRDEGSK